MMKARRVAPFLSTLAVLFAACCPPSAEAETRTLVVEAGKQARVNCPTSVDLPEGVVKAKLVDKATGKEVACQVGGGKLWFILDQLAAGASKTYSVELGAESAASPKAVALSIGSGKIDVAIGGKPFTSYVHNLPKCKCLDRRGKEVEYQTRRPYFYPVYGPGQLPMTRPYPMGGTDIPKNVARDHPHHTSIYVAYGSVNGVDNWSIGGGAGWILHKGFQSMVSGPVFGQFVESLDWTTRDKKPVMAETRTARVYNQPDTHRMLDLEIAFEAKYGAVKFGDTKEGGICATRMRPELRHDRKGLLVNDSGQKGGAAWGKKATWTSASGEVDGKRCGFAIFDHPGNLRHPTTWHARTYGLLTANPFGLSYFTRKKEQGDYTLEADKELVFRYRIYFHLGDEKAGQVAARYADYATPPKAEWK